MGYVGNDDSCNSLGIQRNMYLCSKHVSMQLLLIMYYAIRITCNFISLLTW